MTVNRSQPRRNAADRAPRDAHRRAAVIIRLLLAGLLGVGAAVLVACGGGSGAGLIPAENAGPLVADFQAVERAAAKGNGDCTPTRAALHTTERDFQSLPASVDTGLRRRLHEGILHLQTLALELCAQPLASTTTTGTTTAPAPSPPSTAKTTPTTGEQTATSPTGGSTPGATTPTPGTEGGTSPELEGTEGNSEETGKGNGSGGSGGGEAEEEAANNGGAGVPGGDGSGNGGGSNGGNGAGQ